MEEVGPQNVDWFAYVEQTIGKKHPIAARVLKRAECGYDSEDHKLLMSFGGIAKGPIEHIALLRIDTAKLASDFSELVQMDIELCF